MAAPATPVTGERRDSRRARSLYGVGRSPVNVGSPQGRGFAIFLVFGGGPR
jgi:hypothetical protein